MATLVSVDSLNGNLVRYESAGLRIRETHGCTNNGPFTFNREVVEAFRTSPSSKFATPTLADPPTPCDVA